MCDELPLTPKERGAMNSSTLLSHELDKDPAGALKAADNGPVLIVENGATTHVLLTIEEYLKLAGKTETSFDFLAPPEAEEAEFEPPSPDL
jgi:hypothetical protein